MRTGIFIFVLALATAQTLVAQTPTAQQESYTFNLKQCVEYALENHVNTKNAKLDIVGAQAKVSEVRSIGLPQINGSGQFLNNAKVQTQFIPAGAFSSPVFADLGGYVVQVGVQAAPTVPIPSSLTQSQSTEEVQGIGFGVRYSSQLSLSATQLIFNGSFFVGLQAAKALVELSQKSKIMTDIQVVENVTKAYYMAVINSERKKLFDVNLARLDSSLYQLRASKNAGFVEDIDVKRLEVARNNLQIEKDKFANIDKITTAALKFQMGFPQENELQVADQVNSLNLTTTNAEQNDFSYSNRAEYNMLESRRRLLTYDISQNEMGYLPSLVAFGNLGINTGHIHLQKLNSKWTEYYNYGLSLSIPVFDGLTKSAKIQQAKVNLNKADNDLLNMKQIIDFQRAQSKLSYDNALKSVDSQKKNVTLAEEVAKVSKIKYEKGIGSNLEVLTAETTLKETQINYYNALYDLMIAKIELDKANGNLK